MVHLINLAFVSCLLALDVSVGCLFLFWKNEATKNSARLAIASWAITVVLLRASAGSWHHADVLLFVGLAMLIVLMFMGRQAIDFEYPFIFGTVSFIGWSALLDGSTQTKVWSGVLTVAVFTLARFTSRLYQTN